MYVLEGQIPKNNQGLLGLSLFIYTKYIIFCKSRERKVNG